MNRKPSILTLRPAIETIDPDLPTNPAERFQNETLRPILKFQNELLQAMFNNYLVKRKARWADMTVDKRQAYINQAVRKDLRFRALLIGMVCGLFSVEEWATYTADEGELRKRLVNLVVERLVWGNC